jgi:hypothetical protein
MAVDLHMGMFLSPGFKFMLTRFKEGIATCIAALIAYWFIVDFPEDAKNSWKFLSEEETQIMIDRVDHDRGDAHLTKFSLKEYLKVSGDWKVWFFAANFGLSAVVTYAVAYFLPIVLKDGLGYSTVASLCLPAPVSTLLFNLISY